VERLHAIRVEFEPDGKGGQRMREIPGSEFEIPADLVLLAMGFLGPERNGMLWQFGVSMTPRGNVAVNDDKMTSVPGVFAAGDMARGQSLIVWAITEGRQAARGVDRFLMGTTNLR
jgi:glutamate synthase (NADPH/NADH) small chain